MNTSIKISDLFDLKETIAAEIFNGCEYPWEALPKICNFILKLGPSLSTDEYDQPEKNVWISRTATVAPSACIKGPCIIGHNAEIRHCAFIRGSAIVGENAVVGNSTELKNVILFNEVQVPHFNYVGDSILGHKAHLGAGAITSNVKSDRGLVKVRLNNGSSNTIDSGRAAVPSAYADCVCGDVIKTEMKKVGAMLGDCVEVGCNSVLNPGTIVGRNTMIYPLSLVFGCVPADSIYKDRNNIVHKKSDWV